VECRIFHDAKHCAIVARARRRREAVRAARVTHQLAITVCSTVACDQAFIVQQLGTVEGGCLESIIGKEDYTYNPEQPNLGGSGAYGIPQAIGGMDSAGADWRTNPLTQIRWMIAYVDGRYGSACQAWSFWTGHSWY